MNSFQQILVLSLYRVGFHGVVANVLNLDVVVSEFELQSCHYVHFPWGKVENSLSPHPQPAMGYIVPLLLLNEDSFG